MHTSQPLEKLRKFFRSASLLLVLFLHTNLSFTQSLGDLAREQRRRKEVQPVPTRVFTNEDLERPRILDAEERARFQATAQRPSDGSSRPQPLPAINWPAETPLGDIARFYRVRKELDTESLRRLAQQMSEQMLAAREAASTESLTAGLDAAAAPMAAEPASQPMLELTMPSAAPLASGQTLLEDALDSLRFGGDVGTESLRQVVEQHARDSRPELFLAVPWPEGTPLGDIARYYRLQREMDTGSLRHVVDEMKASQPPAASAEGEIFLALPWPGDNALAGIAPSYTLPSEPDTDPLRRIADDSFAARRITSTASSEALAAPRPEPIPAIEWPAGTPLGDIARYYRARRELNTEPLRQIAAEHTAIPEAPAQPAPTDVPDYGMDVAQPARRDTGNGGNEMLTPPRVIRVGRGDSLWKLAARYLGSALEWARVAAANPEIEDPDLIYPGQEIRLPVEMFFASDDPAVMPIFEAVAAANQSAVRYSGEAAGAVRVQLGDTLWKLAKEQLGAGENWSCIAESNPQIQAPDVIYPGQVLILPSACDLRS